MHLRRAVLLFAIVLAIGAAAASLSGGERKAAPPSPPPTRAPEASSPRAGRPAGQRATLRLGTHRNRALRVAAGSHTVLSVEVARPGEVELRGLGLLAAADPHTPATFDLLPAEPGRFPIVFRAGRGQERRLGALVVTRAPR